MPTYGNYLSPEDIQAQEDIKRKAAYASRLRDISTTMPTNTGRMMSDPGIPNIITSLGAALMGRRASGQASEMAQTYAQDKRQRLIDAMQGINTAKTPEELQALGGQLMLENPGMGMDLVRRAQEMRANAERLAAQEAQWKRQMDAQQANWERNLQLRQVAEDERAAAAERRHKESLAMRQAQLDATLQRVAQGSGDPSDIRSAQLYMERVNAERAAQGLEPITFEQAFGVTVRAPTIKETAGGFVTPTPEGELATMTSEGGATIPLPREADPGLAQNKAAAKTTGEITADQNAGITPPQVPSGSIPARGAGPQSAAPQAPPQSGHAPGLGYKKSQELQAKRAAELPKAKASMVAFRDTVGRMNKAIDRAKALSSDWSTGLGSMLAPIPATDARKLASEVKSLVANLGFQALSEMRQNSPTGGGLGNVTEQEIAFLQSTLENLDTGVGPGDFIEKLDRLKEALDKSSRRMEESFMDTYGGIQSGQPSAAPAAKAEGGGWKIERDQG